VKKRTEYILTESEFECAALNLEHVWSWLFHVQGEDGTILSNDENYKKGLEPVVDALRLARKSIHM
jgi:hypothetical protein